MIFPLLDDFSFQDISFLGPYGARHFHCFSRAKMHEAAAPAGRHQAIFGLAPARRCRYFRRGAFRADITVDAIGFTTTSRLSGTAPTVFGDAVSRLRFRFCKIGMVTLTHGASTGAGQPFATSLDFDAALGVVAKMTCAGRKPRFRCGRPGRTPFRRQAAATATPPMLISAHGRGYRGYDTTIINRPAYARDKYAGATLDYFTRRRLCRPVSPILPGSVLSSHFGDTASTGMARYWRPHIDCRPADFSAAISGQGAIITSLITVMP